MLNQQAIPMENNGQGMNITGNWLNKRTGKTITVRDSIMDGDQFIIFTNDGQQIPMNVFSAEYIQMSDDIYDESGKNIIGHATQDDNAQLTKEIVDDSYTPTITRVPKIEKEFNNSNKKSNKKTKIVQESKNYELIDTIFNKVDCKPTFKINMKCDNFPYSELNMIMRIFDVTSMEISDYLLNKFVTEDELKKSISKFITELMLLKFKQSKQNIFNENFIEKQDDNIEDNNIEDNIKDDTSDLNINSNPTIDLALENNSPGALNGVSNDLILLSKIDI